VQSIDDRIAGDQNGGFRDALSQKVVAVARGRGEVEIAEQIRDVRRRTTMSYVGVFPTQMDAFAPVIPLLREE